MESMKIAHMEKSTAHYKLDAIKAAIAAAGVSLFTRTAVTGYTNMGLSDAQAVEVVLGLQRTMLFKSMTTYADHTIWQDVYHAPCSNGKTAYIKITLRSNGAVVIQFKEK